MTETPPPPGALHPRPLDMRVVRILVVDDDPQAGALIEMALIDAHFERIVEVVTTATAGLNRIKADAHDIYLVDHRLPDGTGLQLIHEAKALGTHRPFILMTGYGSGALDEAALREGAAMERRQAEKSKKSYYQRLLRQKSKHVDPVIDHFLGRSQ